MAQTPLPDAEKGAAATITIVAGELASEPETLCAAREQARIIASEKQSTGAGSAHPIVDRTIAALRKAKPGPNELVAVNGTRTIKCTVGPDSIDRLAEFLPRLVQAAATQGFALKAGEEHAHFARESEAIGFSITEQVQREKHQLTDTEQAKLDAWEQKCARSREPWRYHFDRPSFPEWDYRPTGKLGLVAGDARLRDLAGPPRRFRG